MRGIVRQSIYRSVGPYVRPSGKVEKNGLDACVWGLGCGWGLDAPVHQSGVRNSLDSLDTRLPKSRAGGQGPY